MEYELPVIGSNDSDGFSDYPYDLNDTGFGLEPIEALPKHPQAFLICLYTVTSLVALGGNVTAIWVLMVGKRSSRELRIFLVNLAASDITMALFSIPFTYTDFMLGRWVFHPLFCPFVQFMQLCSVLVSIYTLTAIGIDRYFAIMWPLQNSRWTAKQRSTITVLLIWVVSIGLSAIQLVHSEAEKVIYANGTMYFYDCREIWPNETAGRLYTMAIFIVTFAVPMIILTYTYASIGWKMFKHTSPGNADAARDEAQLVANMKVVKMLATVVVLFAICWLPLQFYMLMHWFRIEIFDTTTLEGFYLNNGLFFICHWLAMANSFVNPIIYCFMSDNFRCDLRNLAKRGCCPDSPLRRDRNCLQRKMKTKSDRGRGSASFHTTTFITVNTMATSKKNGHATTKRLLNHSPQSEIITTELD